MVTVTRFAPSPNGSLHLGHAYAAIRAHDLAGGRGARALLRIEDIDGARSRPELADEFRRDLAWLELAFEEVPPQSTRLASYEAAAEKLRAMGVLYPCACTRAEIAKAARVQGADGPIYPGTCKKQEPDEVLGRGQACGWRLDVERALALTGPLSWHDTLQGVQQTELDRLGDVVLVRKDAPASYHLAATLDDAADQVTLVTRGWDLFEATHVHRLLQELLGLPVPRWHHHGLLADESGAKLAKSRHSPPLAERRRAGADGAALAAALRACKFPTGISLIRP